MNIAVKFYSETTNPENLPGVWPAETIELGDSVTLPEGFTTIMSIQDYQQYISDNQHLMTPYDVIPASITYKINNNQIDPSYIDYDILGLHKKRIILKGELKTVEYYRNFNGVIYSDLVVKETREYIRNPIGLVQYRILKAEYYMTDDVIGLTKSFTKYYTPQESIQEGIDRRSNIIDDAKIIMLGTVGQTYGFDFLNTYKSEIEIYRDGYKQPLLDAVSNTTKPYMTPVIIANVIAALTF